jgi:hypothetical protein
MRRVSVLLAGLGALLCAHCGTDTGGAGPAGNPDGGTPDVTAQPADAASHDTGNAPDSKASGQPDTGADVAPPDPCAGRIICDDFEKDTTGQSPRAPWSIELAKGTAVVDETRAVSGKRSVKVSIEATSSNDTYRQAMMAITGAPLIPLVNNTVYGRFMVYTDRIPDSTVHWTFASGHGPIGNLSAVYNYGGMGGLMANYYKNTSPNPTDCWQTKNQTFPTGAWTCVGFEFDGPNNEMHFWLNGTEVPELHVLGNAKTAQTCTVASVDGRWLAPTFDNVSVGWESYQNDTAGAHDAWIDDVILDDKPIGCPP